MCASCSCIGLRRHISRKNCYYNYTWGNGTDNILDQCFQGFHIYILRKNKSKRNTYKQSKESQHLILEYHWCPQSLHRLLGKGVGGWQHPPPPIKFSWSVPLHRGQCPIMYSPSRFPSRLLSSFLRSSPQLPQPLHCKAAFSWWGRRKTTSPFLICSSSPPTSDLIDRKSVV